MITKIVNNFHLGGKIKSALGEGSDIGSRKLNFHIMDSSITLGMITKMIFKVSYLCFIKYIENI